MPREGGLSDQRSELVTAAEAAAILGVRTATIYAYASRGLLGGSARGPGRTARYPRALVETLKTKAAARAGHAAVAAAALRWGEPVLDSAVTKLTPRGPVYRGKRAIDLVGSRFEEVAELLWQRKADWSAVAPRVVTKVPRPSVNALVRVMALLSLRDAPIDFAPAVIRRLACAAGDAEPLAERQPTIAGALGASLRGRVLSPRDRKLLDSALVLIADHELNASTFAARIATAAGARWPEAFIAALATATGVRHAAACDGAERLWAAVRAAKSVAPWVKEQPVLEGFEAGAYPDGDPRGDRLVSLITPRLSVRERATLRDLLDAVREETGQFPSVDLGLVLVAHVLQLPQGSASVIFAIGRTAGWVAHIEEQALSKELIRPRARVVLPTE